MSVYKNEKNNTWYVMVRYNDWKGERKQKCQRGFATKQEAQNWERQFQLQKKADVMMDKPLSFYAFEMLYWCGIREGELLALTPANFDFESRTVTINKSYQRLKGKDVVTVPKTKKSNRIIKIPQFLADEMKDCFKLFYSLKANDRIFPVTKHYSHHEMDRSSKAAGVKRIPIHSLRQLKVKPKTKILLSFLQKIFCFPFNLYAIFFKNIDFINKNVN